MTPEQRLDRAERILVRLAKSGREARSEFRQKIDILIQAQMETTEQIKGLAARQETAEKEMADLRKSQNRTDVALRAFINSLRKGGNENSSN